ncbi:hypothetical protein [Mesorhizobium sp. DCY119]|uniref:hypothetical protein n=1 Tax=Mesorhizobium sp. DCY119 TaxID=2108445 RepID=UPI0010590946|nr:hypothetical protein [Mesorhizobium sp. DCY119]
MSLSFASKYSGFDIKEYRMETRSRRSMKMAFFCAAIAAVTAGCTSSPDMSATTSSVSNVSGYPELLIDKKPVVQEKASKSVLPVRLTSGVYAGRAPYICTPSGFGRTSSCFLRGSAS